MDFSLMSPDSVTTSSTSGAFADAPVTNENHRNGVETKSSKANKKETFTPEEDQKLLE